MALSTARTEGAQPVPHPALLDDIWGPGPPFPANFGGSGCPARFRNGCLFPARSISVAILAQAHSYATSRRFFVVMTMVRPPAGPSRRRLKGSLKGLFVGGGAEAEAEAEPSPVSISTTAASTATPGAASSVLRSPSSIAAESSMWESLSADLQDIADTYEIKSSGEEDGDDNTEDGHDNTEDGHDNADGDEGTEADDMDGDKDIPAGQPYPQTPVDQSDAVSEEVAVFKRQPSTTEMRADMPRVPPWSPSGTGSQPQGGSSDQLAAAPSQPATSPGLGSHEGRGPQEGSEARDGGHGSFDDSWWQCNSWVSGASSSWTASQTDLGWQHAATWSSSLTEGEPASSTVIDPAIESLLVEVQELYKKEVKENPEKFAKGAETADASEFQKLLKDALDDGDIKDPNGALAQRFRRSVKENVEWQQCKSRSDKADFRKRWVQKEWKIEEHRRQKTSSHSDVRHQKGIFEPLDVIIGKEGGSANPENIRAAKNYALECLAVGKKYVRFNTWTKRLEFLYVKHGQDKLWQDKWEITQTDTDGKDATKSAEGAGGQESEEEEEEENPKKKRKIAAKAKGKGKEEPKRKKAELKGKVKVNKSKTALQVSLQKATKLRTEYHASMSNAQQLLDQVKTNPKFELFKGISEKLATAVTSLKGSLSHFASDFLVMDSKDVKSKYGDDATLAEIGIMSPKVESLLHEMDDERKKLLEHVKVEDAKHEQKTPNKQKK